MCPYHSGILPYIKDREFRGRMVELPDREATGRDVWIFEEQEGKWLAIWRTTLEMEETPLSQRDAGTV